MLGNLYLLANLLLPAFAALVVVWRSLAKAERSRVGMAGGKLYAFLIAAAYLLPSLWLLYGACLVAIPLFARRSEQVAPFMLIGMVALPALPMALQAGPVFIIELTVPLIITLSALLALFIVPGKRANVRLTEALPVIAVALIYVAMGMRDAELTGAIRRAIVVLLSFVAPTLVVLATTRTIVQVRTFLSYFVLTAAAMAGVALNEAIRAWSVYRALYAHFPEATVAYSTMAYKMRAGFLRAAGPFPEPTSFGYFLMLGLLAAVAMRGSFRSGFHQLQTVLLTGAGLLAPVARAAWLGSVLGIAVTQSYRHGAIRLFAALTALAIAATVLVPVLEKSSTGAQIFGSNGEASGTVDYRRMLLQRGIEEVSRKPVFGGSFPDVSSRMADMKQGEGIIDYVNGYLYIALHAGLVGLTIFIVALGWPAVRMMRARRRMRREAATAEPAAFVAAASVAMLIMTPLSGFGGFTEPMFAILVALSAVLARRPARMKRAIAAPVTEPGPSPA